MVPGQGSCPSQLEREGSLGEGGPGEEDTLQSLS
jgi:hypothetical protein